MCVYVCVCPFIVPHLLSGIATCKGFASQALYVVPLKPPSSWKDLISQPSIIELFFAVGLCPVVFPVVHAPHPQSTPASTAPVEGGDQQFTLSHVHSVPLTTGLPHRPLHYPLGRQTCVCSSLHSAAGTLDVQVIPPPTHTPDAALIHYSWIHPLLTRPGIPSGLLCSVMAVCRRLLDTFSIAHVSSISEDVLSQFVSLLSSVSVSASKQAASAMVRTLCVCVCVCVCVYVCVCVCMRVCVCVL